MTTIPEYIVNRPRVALVSMPWVSAWMPSIQLAILRQCLEGVAEADTYEFYVDYATTISESLYRRLSEAGGIIEEWLFSKQYFESEGIKMSEGFLDEFPSFDLGSRELERKMLLTLVDVTNDYLIRLRDEHDWSRYDVVAFSLTIYQTAPSMALARLIRLKYPNVRIVFGGNSCAGPAAKAILEICPYVDVIVRGEAEPVFAHLIQHLATSKRYDDIGSLTFRDKAGTIIETLPTGLHQPQRVVTFPNYDAYFERINRLQLSGYSQIWLPFESSRGCWWGEKSQCTFCGLHEIMRYRARDPDDVIRELDWLYARYGISRFFATDLIMPHSYYKTFLPKLIRSGRTYEFFYELKGNVTREMMAMLAAAGVKDLQPGLESLSTHVLKLMKKGISATQNVQFLKWAAEYELRPGFNIIIGMPGEDAEENERVAEKVPGLYHLQPPYLIQFELDRFSPCFEKPESYGISNIRPLYIYKYIFPIEDRILRSLVYRFEYDAVDFNGTPPWLDANSTKEYAASLRSEIEAWHSAHARGASLILSTFPDGTAEIHDTRFSEEPTIYRLVPDNAALYEYLDKQRAIQSIAGGFAVFNPVAYESLGGKVVVEAQVNLWLEERLLFEEDGYVVALAVAKQPRLYSIPEAAAKPLYQINYAGKTSLEPPQHQIDVVPKFPSDAETMTQFLREWGVINGSSVISMKMKQSTRIAYLISLADGKSLFVKQYGSAPEGETRIYQALEAGVLTDDMKPFLPKRYLYDTTNKIAVYEGLADHRTWLDLLKSREGFKPRLATTIGSLIADLHLLPQFEAEGYIKSVWSAVENPIRIYDRVTVEEFAHASGFHYREFLEVVQKVSSELRVLRDAWRPSKMIHGDLKADNVLVARGGKHFSASLVDWELAGLGDPLFDVGTAVGSVVMAWLSLVQASESDNLEHWFGRSPISSASLGRCITALTRTYFERVGIPENETGRRHIWQYAGFFLLERGFVATWTAGRLNLCAKLSMELGARILKMPDCMMNAFLLTEDKLS